jgi:hypothetical protein
MVSSIIALIALVFIFSGVFSPSRLRGMHEGAVAGEVNGEPISLADFSRELQRRMEFFKSMGGGGLTEAQLKAFGLREGVFKELVNRKLMLQEAEKQGMMATKEEIRSRVREIKAFEKDGKFDALQYKATLEANNYTPASFEHLISDEIVLEKWNDYFKNRVRVSEEEIKSEFLVSKDKRNIKYVLLTSEAGKKDVKVSDDDVKKFLADPAKLNLAKSQYEGKKATEYKGKTFDSVKDQIAREVLASDKTEEIKKNNERLAALVLPLLTADKGSDAKVNAALKPYNVTVKSTGMMSRSARFIPGVGEAPELMNDAFAEKSPIDPKAGGKAKKYQSSGWSMVAVVSETETPDLAKLQSERDQLLKQISFRKERELYEAWLKKLTDKARIKKNDAVIGGDTGEA